MEKMEGQHIFTSKDKLFNAFATFQKDTATEWRCSYKDPKFGKFGVENA